MVYQFRIFSDEIDLFERIIEIDSDALFSDFHQAILGSVKYKNDDVTSFFLCDDRSASAITGVVLPVDGGFAAYSGV